MIDDKKIQESFQVVGSKRIIFFFEWFELIAQSIIVVAFTFVFLFRIFSVDGESMLNTLHHRDRIIVQRFLYTPEKGQVVVVRKYNKMSASIIKRIIAIEDEEINIDFDSGRVFVNDQMLKEPYIKERMRLKGNMTFPLKIPKNCCFVMGDNRNNSSDSRFTDLGLVPYDYIVGKAFCIYFPFYRIGMIDSVSKIAQPGEENGVPDVADDKIYDQSNVNNSSNSNVNNNSNNNENDDLPYDVPDDFNEIPEE